MNTFSMTDIGRRRAMNQDFLYSSQDPVGNLPNLFIVADGMGGHRAGDYASKYAVEVIVGEAAANASREPAVILREAIQRANEQLCIESAKNPEHFGMGTTVVAAVIDRNHLFVANVGDSRLYVFDAGAMHQVTVDHSLVEEMVRMGKLDQEGARTHPDRNIITRVIGDSSGEEVDIFERELRGQDIVLLCSDGLTNMMTDREIHQVVTGSGDLAERGKRLIKLANQNGGKDNVTVILIEHAGEVGSC